MILFVGDRPSQKMTPGAKPFQGAACEKRLMEWTAYLGCRYTHVIVNSHENDHLDWQVQNTFKFNGKIIALGNNASKALGDIPHFKLPHPSGRNRQINNKAFIESRLKACKEWLKGEYVNFRR